ncbi:MAG: elongation factor P [bacterium]
MQAIDCKVGTRCEIDGELYISTDYVQRAQGGGRGLITVKLKNLRTGSVVEKRFRSGESLERVIFDQRKMQYLYKDDTGFVFMDLENYEQVAVPEAVVTDMEKYLKLNAEVQVNFYKEEPVLVDVGDFVELKVTEAPPGMKGNTATGATKQITLETGLEINVPLFINEGDVLKIDTRTCAYVTRV